MTGGQFGRTAPKPLAVSNYKTDIGRQRYDTDNGSCSSSHCLSQPRSNYSREDPAETAVDAMDLDPQALSSMEKKRNEAKLLSSVFSLQEQELQQPLLLEKAHEGFLNFLKQDTVT
ncbi:hypothetical protein PGTUg99_008447 [Puccinia graminis f. sp. tritici]|uniref:Uncharacterized protein n=1 Tax=Puccinia graminis f. sp. tritici TaxID=56615 RepID=A0A5B0QQR8_PUCGR|nr:hypothetical protein PGTUg99_008447 [Puccinia graminis f. sp. tritici]